MDLRVHIHHASKTIRDILKDHAYKKYADKNHDLQGYCEVASILLFRRFKSDNTFNFLPRIHIDINEHHAFNTIKIDEKRRFILDITATQFHQCDGDRVFLDVELVRNNARFHCFENWKTSRSFSSEEGFRKYTKRSGWEVIESVEDILGELKG